MRIDRSPPATVTIDGREHRILPTVARVLRALEALTDEDLLEGDRLALAVCLLFRRPYPAARPDAIEAAFAAINEPSPYRARDKGRRGLDYEQDANLIIAAFRQTYGIDLQREARRMDWRVFRALLSGIGTDTQLGQIIEIRTRDVPKRTKHNAEMIREIQRLKAEYAVRPRAGRGADSYGEGLAKMALALTSMAKRGEADG